MTDAEREAQIRQRQVDRSAVNLNPPSTQQLMQDISDLLRLLDEARAEIARRQEVEDGLVARLASRHEELLRLQSPPGASAMERAALFRKEQLDPWLRDYSITPLAEYEARFDQMFARAIEQAEAQARAKAIETGHSRRLSWPNKSSAPSPC